MNTQLIFKVSKWQLAILMGFKRKRKKPKQFFDKKVRGFMMFFSVLEEDIRLGWLRIISTRLLK
ncbi:hypothetical protein HanRHA438_Chr08g0347181 [Helianthus annuus]|uniref:Uncharacterized protein n=1 Tax=Helianthus annuus TaxID=4232 RepID=A0A251U5U8_HELAN|nr:hypothetical protein HanXRQr2_Chr08g0335791 [Helianthus annuus]KAJ0546582.1 hypothetical protein HanIR_Chr08g0362561 [Helianthus annuus]KAJ0553281.1 hypothetical protein HanHA89_Chr08g0294671 [Helianthus annuus]KAJ0718954.1 hypothetical protein HanLR1_Chr08g0276371 [Helianthus annuus]KAJ0722193.1 hypothetical protein HanOQP8_Chr08g0283921 [Helianthus annuus]